MADGFTTKLESYSRRIRRWATRREIERHSYGCQTWYDEGEPSGTVLTLDMYLDPAATADYRDNGAYYAPYEGEVWNHVHGELAWVDEMVMGFGKSDLTASARLITGVEDVPPYLRADDAWRDGIGSKEYFDDGGALPAGELQENILLDTAMEVLKTWNGVTADAYQETFVGSSELWREVCLNNYALSEYLIAGAESQLAINLTARESVIRICSNTIEALWGVNEGDSEGDKTTTFLTIAGALTTLLLVNNPVTGAIAAAAFAIGTDLVGRAQSDSGEVEATCPNGEENTIDGSTPADVLECMANALTKVTQTAIQHEETTRDMLRSAYNAVVSSAAARTEFEITFKDGTPTDAMGEPETSLVESDVKEAATVLFPASAERVLFAHGKLADSTGDDGAFTADNGGGTTVIKAAWTDLRDLLQDLTGANAAKIAFAGEFLLDYCVQIGALDQSNADDVRQTYGEIATTGREYEPWYENPGPDDPQ